MSQFPAYAEVIPSKHSSGVRSFNGQVIKEGNRRLLWEAVGQALRADFDLRCYYNKLKKSKRVNAAKVAIARRLLTIIYQILKEKRSYFPYWRYSRERIGCLHSFLSKLPRSPSR